jgi:uncharacterized alpha-E superfamily protein
MLSRVADNLYWMSRYLERAEHTARLLDVNLSQMLDQTPTSAEKRWDRLLRTVSQQMAATDPYAITYALTFDAANPASIVACIAAARENAQQVREQISSEMWVQLNSLYHRLQQTTMDTVWQAEPFEFYHGVVKEGIHLFQGITDATLSHGEGWHFIQNGRYLERAINTTALLEAHFEPSSTVSGYVDLNYLEWVDLLKSCTSFEAYLKVYTAQVEPKWIAEFVLLNDESPRSVRFAADCIQTSISAIVNSTGRRRGEKTKRTAGRLQAALDYGQIDEIMEEGLHAYCAGIRRHCEQVNNAIYQTYINPIVKVPGA